MFYLVIMNVNERSHVGFLKVPFLGHSCLISTFPMPGYGELRHCLVHAFIFSRLDECMFFLCLKKKKTQTNKQQKKNHILCYLKQRNFINAQVAKIISKITFETSKHKVNHSIENFLCRKR